MNKRGGGCGFWIEVAGDCCPYLVFKSNSGDGVFLSVLESLCAFVFLIVCGLESGMGNRRDNVGVVLARR